MGRAFGRDMPVPRHEIGKMLPGGIFFDWSQACRYRKFSLCSDDKSYDKDSLPENILQNAGTEKIGSFLKITAVFQGSVNTELVCGRYMRRLMELKLSEQEVGNGEAVKHWPAEAGSMCDLPGVWDQSIKHGEEPKKQCIFYAWQDGFMWRKQRRAFCFLERAVRVFEGKNMVVTVATFANAIFYFIEGGRIDGRLLFASDSSVAGADRLAGAAISSTTSICCR